MTEVPISLPNNEDAHDAEKAIDAAISASGLRVTLRASLGKFPGSIHWHVKKGHNPGTLEITLWPQDHRAWFSIQDGRKGDWIDDAMTAIAQLIP